MTVNQAIIAQIRVEAEAAGGAEVCGALLGGPARVACALPVPNQSTDPVRGFLIPAVDVLRIERAADASGQSVVGFYHSHPAGRAEPSLSDLEHALPGYIYLIVPAEGAARAWRLREDRSGFDEVSE